MSEQKVKIPRVSDIEVADTFFELAKKYGSPNINVNAAGFVNLSSVPVTGTPTEEWTRLLEADSYLIQSMYMQIKGALNLYYRRGGSDGSGIFDEIAFSNSSNPGSVDNLARIELTAFLTKRLRAINVDRAVAIGQSEAMQELAAIHQATLERLEQTNTKLIETSAEFRENLEARYESKVAAYEKDISEKKAALEEEVRKKIESLEAQRTALQERIKSIDDRNNTHARRETRDQMLADVKNRIQQFGVSEATSAKRKPVFWGLAVLIAALIGLLVWTGYEINLLKDPTTVLTYWLWGRFTLLSLGLVGAVLFYVRWENNWAQRHADSEFQLQQFYLDVNRANWVVESVLEWRKETDSPIPAELVKSMTSGLFSYDTPSDPASLNPSDALASALMGASSKLKLKFGENEMEFDKPGKISKAKVKADSDD